jgi:acyl-CoA synthetase (AMP-forming)/AMP-acid ligase II
MIAQQLQERLERYGDQLAVIRGDRRESYRELARRSDALFRAWTGLAGKRVGLCVGDPFLYISAAIALDRLDAHVYLAGKRSEGELRRLSETFDWDVRVGDEDVEEAAARGGALAAGAQGEGTGGRGLATIMTSGTSGIPKAANYTWEVLAAPIHRNDAYVGARWLCVLPLYFHTGLMVFLQSLLTSGVLVIPASQEPGEISRTMLEGGVHYASGTPTFWRWLLAFAPKETLQACSLKQINLGGEIATQDVLDGLRRVFPTARIVHHYGLTEMGRLFSVADGREGFPARLLEEPPRAGTELKVVDGQLMARSRLAMLAYDGQTALRDQNDGWFATGDLVEIQGNRVFFRGRMTDLINVGGRKVMPADVEAVLRTIPGVVEVRAYGRRSSLAGQLVAADLVLAAGVDAEQATAEAQRVAHEKLAPFQVPRLIQVVPAITRSDVFKILRRET